MPATSTAGSAEAPARPARRRPTWAGPVRWRPTSSSTSSCAVAPCRTSAADRFSAAARESTATVRSTPSAAIRASRSAFSARRAGSASGAGARPPRRTPAPRRSSRRSGRRRRARAGAARSRATCGSSCAARPRCRAVGVGLQPRQVRLEPVEVDARDRRLDLPSERPTCSRQERQRAFRRRRHGAPPEGGATVTTVVDRSGHDEPGLKFDQFFSSSGFWARHWGGGPLADLRGRVPHRLCRPSTSCCAGALPFRSTCGGKKFCSQTCCPVVLNGVQLLVDRVWRSWPLSNRSSAGGVPVFAYQASSIAGVCRNIRKSRCLLLVLRPGGDEVRGRLRRVVDVLQRAVPVDRPLRANDVGLPAEVLRQLAGRLAVGRPSSSRPCRSRTASWPFDMPTEPTSSLKHFASAICCQAFSKSLTTSGRCELNPCRWRPARRRRGSRGLQPSAASSSRCRCRTRTA